MKQIGIVLAGAAIALCALLPAAATAQEDELEVTMEVLDSIEDIDGDVIVMPGPEDGDTAESDPDDGGIADIPAESGDEIAERDFADAGTEDDFAHDEDFESGEDEEHFERESDFDEGDDIDLDIPDEVPMDEEEQVEGDSGFEADPVSVLAQS